MTETTPTPATETVRVVDHTSSTTVHAQDVVPQREGILATARDHKTDQPAMSLNDETRIRVGNVGMQIKHALREGLLIKDSEAPEGYREATEEERAARASSEAPAQREMARLDEVTERNLDTLVNGFEAMGVDAMSLVAKTFDAPEEVAKALDDFARHHNNNPDEVKAAWVNAVHAFAGQARGTIAAEGLDAEKVLDWAWENHRHLSKSAAMRAFAGSLDGWRQLGNMYREAHGIARGAAADAVTVLSQKDGIVRARLPHGKVVEISEATAKRMGYIR